MIKVLRIINRFNLGGPTYNASYLTAYLPDNFETKLIGGAHEAHEGESTFIPEQLQVEFLIIEELQREISFFQDRKAYQKIRKIIREFKPDIVHTHASKAGFVGRLAASKEKVSVIVHTFHGHVFHSYFGKLKTNLFKKLERYAAKKSDAIIAISELQKKELCEVHKIAPDSKFKIIPLGFDLNRFQENLETRRANFRKEHGLQDDEIVIGIIGRLTAIKNHQLFFNSIFEVVKSSHEKIKVFVIGDGELMEVLKVLANEIEQKTGEQIFVFTSWIKNIEMALPGLDIVCLSSLNEGTPVSLIEAQAAGIPVLTTNVGGVRNVVEDEKTGYIVDSFEVADYSAKLLKLVNSEEIRQKMSQNGWNHVQEKFHYVRLCADVADLYLDLLNKKGISK